MAAIIARRLCSKKYRLFLFGSRASGKVSQRSDYDLAILADKPVPPAMMAVLRQDLEAIPILQKIDLVDLKSASAMLKSQVVKHGRLLDER